MRTNEMGRRGGVGLSQVVVVNKTGCGNMPRETSLCEGTKSPEMCYKTMIEKYRSKT